VQQRSSAKLKQRLLYSTRRPRRIDLSNKATKGITFNEATIKGNAVFTGAKIEGDIKFREATIEGGTINHLLHCVSVQDRTLKIRNLLE